MQEGVQAFHRILDPQDNQTGGGAASAIAGAMGAALVAMVARLSIGRKGMAPETYYQEIDAEAQNLSDKLLAGAEADSLAFDAVMAAYRLPKESEDQKVARSEAIQVAMIQATRVPLANARRCRRALELAGQLKGRSNPNAASDLECAHLLALAGLRGALSNAQINLDALQLGEIRQGLQAGYNSLRASEADYR